MQSQDKRKRETNMKSSKNNTVTNSSTIPNSNEQQQTYNNLKNQPLQNVKTCDNQIPTSARQKADHLKWATN